MSGTRWIPAAAMAGPAVAGVAAWVATGEWRWSITGILAGAALLAIVIAVAAFLGTDVDAGGPGCVLTLLVLFALAPLSFIALWLWTGNPEWLLGLFTPLLAVIVIFTIDDA